jgi:LysM repeat protein
MAKRILQLMVIMVVLVAPFASVSHASAWSGCDSYITVQWGDTLSGIAQRCGTTIKAIQGANPGLGWWLYAGQVLYIPTGYSDPVYNPPSGGNYVVQPGDTLGKIARRIGVSWRDILALNPQIHNPSLIYVGQVISLPAGTGYYPPPKHDPPPQYPPHSDYPIELAALKIDYKYGLFVRTQPGGPVIASGLDKSVWYYKVGSAFVDSKWRVWVEVVLYPPVKGHTSGWMLVKDQFGAYFTDPRIDR